MITSCLRYFKVICLIQANQSKLFKNKAKISQLLNMQLISTVLFIKAKLETWYLKKRHMDCERCVLKLQYFIEYLNKSNVLENNTAGQTSSKMNFMKVSLC